MKRKLKWLALAALILSSSSCGLPMAAARTTGNLANQVGGLLGPAAMAAAL